SDRPEPVPAVVPVRGGHPRPARAAGRALHARQCSGGGARMRHARAALVVVVALFGTTVSTSTETYVITTLVNVAIVVALYVFIGNSGVLSFGHISFVAVGAWAAGVLSMPVQEKPAIMPHLFGLLGDHTIGNVWSLALAAAVGATYALVVGLPLMRLSGLAA